MLLLSAVLTLMLANTSWGVARYFSAVWGEHLRFSLNGLVLDRSLLHWINDGLMTIFCLIVGLAFQREAQEGELSSWRQAPLLFTSFNHGTATASGWGIPMDTNVAFALAVLQLLRPRVPLGLNVFLTALAIVDDLGAVLVICPFNL